MDHSESDRPAKKRKCISKSSTACAICDKKLNITEQITNKCLCGFLFCYKHRFSDKHGCTYDYKEEGRKLLKKNNPGSKKPKLDKI